jgi:hypothetical protein
MPRPKLSNQQIAALLMVKIAKQVQRGAGRGLDAARVFVTSRVREAVSVPAPRMAVRGVPAPGKRKGAILYYKAMTRATPGAPPRKLSGKLRQSIWSKMISPTKAVIGANARGFPTARNPRGANYPAILELSQDPRRRHAFIVPTIQKFRREIGTIMGRELQVSIGQR